MGVLIKIITMMLVGMKAYEKYQDKFQMPEDKGALLAVAMIIGVVAGWLLGAVFTACYRGIVDSVESEILLVKKYIRNKEAVFENTTNREPAQLGFMSGRWIFVILRMIQDTWKSFFTDIQWAYRPMQIRNVYEEIKPINKYDPRFMDELQAEKRYERYVSSREKQDKINDFFNFHIINGTAFIIVGCLLSCFFTVLFTCLGVFATPYVIFFLIAWTVDRIYLQAKKIMQPCSCKQNNLLLHYECPTCGEIHKHLVPGPYGVFRHTCTCGTKLPCTFFSGRSRKAKALCPNCGRYINGAGTRPFMIQMIGGSNAGKTVYISAFYHEFLEKIKGAGNTEYKIETEDKQLFDDLEDWYSGIPCGGTTQMDAQMYTILIHSKNSEISRKFILYDIGGEIFQNSRLEREISQKQFHYCSGIVFILDPFSNQMYRNEMLRNGEELPSFSEMESEDVINVFLNYLTETGNKKIGMVSETPFSVVITKADVKAIRQKINMVKIKAEFKKSGMYKDIVEARDAMCRNFLEEIGLSGLTGTIETQFKEVHYFLASAIGHEPDETEFEPWGVLEPIQWIMEKQDSELYRWIME